MIQAGNDHSPGADEFKGLDYDGGAKQFGRFCVLSQNVGVQTTQNATDNTSPKFWIDAIAPPPLRPSKLCCERDDSGGGDLAGRLLPHGQVLHHGHDTYS